MGERVVEGQAGMGGNPQHMGAQAGMGGDPQHMGAAAGMGGAPLHMGAQAGMGGDPQHVGAQAGMMAAQQYMGAQAGMGGASQHGTHGYDQNMAAQAGMGAAPQHMGAQAGMGEAPQHGTPGYGQHMGAQAVMWAAPQHGTPGYGHYIGAQAGMVGASLQGTPGYGQHIRAQAGMGGDPQHMAPGYDQHVGAQTGIRGAPQHMTERGPQYMWGHADIVGAPHHVTPGDAQYAGWQAGMGRAPHHVTPGDAQYAGWQAGMGRAPHHVTPRDAQYAGWQAGMGGAPQHGTPGDAQYAGGQTGIGGAPQHGTPGDAQYAGGQTGMGRAPQHGTPRDAQYAGGQTGMGGAPQHGTPRDAQYVGGQAGIGEAPHHGTPRDAQYVRGHADIAGAPHHGTPGDAQYVGGHADIVGAPHHGTPRDAQYAGGQADTTGFVGRKLGNTDVGEIDDGALAENSILVRILSTPPKKFQRKVEIHFGSKTKSGGGECSVTELDPETYCVAFRDKEALRRVLEKKDHVIESLRAEVMIADEETILRYKRRLSRQLSNDTTKLATPDIYTSDGKGIDDDPSVMNDGTGKEDYGRSHTLSPSGMTEPKTYSPAGGAGAAELSQEPPLEIFPVVLAKLNHDLISKVSLQDLKHQYRHLEMTNTVEGIEVRGTFSDIDELNDYLQKQFGGKVRKSSETRREKNPADGRADCLCVPAALYQYFLEIYPEKVKGIQTQYKVNITHVDTSEGSAFIRFSAVGSDSSVDQAKNIFTTKIQRITNDWQQKEVDCSRIKALPQDIKQLIKEHCRNTLLIVESDKIILRGPGNELPKAVELLEKGEHHRSVTISKEETPRAAVTFSSRDNKPRKHVTISSRDKTEVLVDVKHMDILQKLRLREMKDIEQKYNVKMEEQTKSGSVCITFRALNGAPDLGPYARHSFISLLQKTITDIEKKMISVGADVQEDILPSCHKELQTRGIDVILECSKDSVVLIGSPVHVALAAEKLVEFFKPQEAQAASGDGTQKVKGAIADDQENNCPICLDQVKNKKALKCKHVFCSDCLKEAMAHKPVCPTCGVCYGTVTGNQPDGTMTDRVLRESLPGFPDCGSIEIHYTIPSGIQKENHPRPGKPFYGTKRIAYLPDNTEGRDILRLLRKAFNQKLIFTVGDSRTTGISDTVTWNDIHHKTSRSGGTARFGYPDRDYLRRVRDELKAKGVE